MLVVNEIIFLLWRLRMGIKPSISITDLIETFLNDCKNRDLSKNTIVYYRHGLEIFKPFCDQEHIEDIEQFNPDLMRKFIESLEKDHNPGGMHGIYRALQAFLFWYVREYDREDEYKNPCLKVKLKAKKLPPLDPVPLDNVLWMAKTCEKGTFFGDRDKAILFFLLDTGVRARELLSLDIRDIDLVKGVVKVRMGKGGKSRITFFGKRSRMCLRAYLFRRSTSSGPLWVTQTEERLSYGGLREILLKRAELANVETPALHDFRRAFALGMLRNGCNPQALAEMMGQENLEALEPYIKLTQNDLGEAHHRSSPVDHLGH